MNAAIATQPAGLPRTILVVEDEPLLRFAVSELLRMRQMTVVESASAEEAETVISSGLPVDLVFTDVRLPGAFDGLELARRLHARDPDLPVLVTSGHLDPAHAAGVRFLRKPYLPSDAVALICRLLDREDPNDA